MKPARNLRRILMVSAASLALFACSDTDIESPGAVAAPAPTPTPTPTPVGADADLVPDTFSESSDNLEVVEITSAAGNTIEVVQISGTITSDITLDAAAGYFLSGTVFVGDGATLTIPAGTQIYGEGADSGLVVATGGTIEANGTAAAPIVFTSLAEYERGNIAGTPADASARGEWLGLVINGTAPINKCDVVDTAMGGDADCQDDGEAGSGVYGGADADDDSGTLNYVRVEFAGVFFNEEDQSNGIAFQGVGTGTTISNIQVHNNGDDGIEFFGGTANASNIVITGASDDSIDWTDGWVGTLQRVLVIQADDAADYAIEADNRSTSAPDEQPRSNPTIANFTFIGNSSENAIRLREGTGATLINGIVTGFSTGLVFGDKATSDLLTGPASSVDSVQTVIASHLFNNTTEVADVVEEDAAGNDVTTETAANVAAALDDVTTGSGDVATPFSFVPGPSTANVTLRNAAGEQLLELLTDPDGLFQAEFGLAVGAQVSTSQIETITDQVETLNDDADLTNDVTAPTYSDPLTVTQTAGTNVFDTASLSNSNLENLEYIGAFSPSETVSENWAADWTKAGTVFTADSAPTADSCPTGTTTAGQIGDDLVCSVTGNITSDLTLERFDNVLYQLDGQVFVGTDGGPLEANASGTVQATLTVEAGVTVFGNGPTDGLVITRGSQLVADGTAELPVVFTSGEAVRGTADYASDTAQWLGISINGKAGINKCDVVAVTPPDAQCQDDGEASSGIFGGGFDADDSGVLDYVRVEFSGIFFSEEDQSNGIAFQGVGSGTDINFIQVHNNGDDGIEFFGGTADAKNVVITGASDDAVDWTDGWKGRIQYLIVEAKSGDDYGFEGDNRSTSAPDTLPRSTPRVANYTILGFSDATPGARFREGMGGDFVNGIIVNTSKGLDIDDRSNELLLGTGTAPEAGGDLAIDGLFLDTAENIDDDDSNVAAVTAAIGALTEGTSTMTGFSFFGSTARGVEPGMTESMATTGANPTTLNEAGETFFESADYLGAVENGTDDWYLGWTVASDGNVTSAN